MTHLSSEAVRLEFERYFIESRKSKGANRKPTFDRFEDGTYKDDHTQRHWWTWQNALSATQRAQAAQSTHWTEHEPVRLAPSRKGRVYLAGPMTGIADFNFPAFNAEAEILRAQGLSVLNPADHGIVAGANWADYLRHDIAGLASCERIHLLSGWSKSKGAQLEVTIAKALGMAITYQDGAETQQAAQGAGEVVAPKLIGWRTENFLWETDDVEKARNWEPNIGVLPIFEGDPNTKLYTHPTPAQPAPVVLDVDALTDKIASMLHGTHHCLRVWEAWQIGTMSEDDFEPVGESDTPREIAEAILEMLAATPAPSAQAAADARDAQPMIPLSMLRPIAVEAIRSITGCPDLSSGDRHLTDEIEAVAIAAIATHQQGARE